ncbi:hypothetical protein J0H58_36260 [bacterium]|nr:hypothetical protein [bacterium]
MGIVIAIFLAVGFTFLLFPRVIQRAQLDATPDGESWSWLRQIYETDDCLVWIRLTGLLLLGFTGVVIWKIA